MHTLMKGWGAGESERLLLTLIQAGADPNAVNSRGETPLHRAVLQGADGDGHCLTRWIPTGALRLLVEHGADSRRTDLSGHTPAQILRTAKRMEGDVDLEREAEILTLLGDLAPPAPPVRAPRRGPNRKQSESGGVRPRNQR